MQREVIYRIAAAASVDPRSVVAYLSGRPPRGMPAARIERALAELGIGRLDVAGAHAPQPLAITSIGKSWA
jgi:hypothetical protein